MGVKQQIGIQFKNNAFTRVDDALSVEVALSIAVNHAPFTVTMQTPGNEFDLARGLLFTENVISNQQSDMHFEVISHDGNGHINGVNIIIDSQYVNNNFAGKRNVISASSCGICGKTSLDDLTCAPINNNLQLNPELVSQLFSTIYDEQHSFKLTGGTHASGAFSLQGQLLSVREDIGRHNAVDKVIGDLITTNRLNEAKIITVSGRISFEIVSKARVAGIPFLASVSAPSSLAVEYAQESGITLLAFCRNNGFTAYSNIDKIQTSTAHKAVMIKK